MTPMNPIWGQIAGVFIVLMMVTFIGIWIWAWRKKHKPTFDRLARLPLELDEEPVSRVDAKPLASREDRP
ncbi:MAG: cbb3-type cytochrome c oxidase subunit 3 [Rhodanobacter sp.]